MFTLQETLFSAALAVFIAASVIVAVVRWGHKCEPYAQHMDYYYPAWRTNIFCFLSLALMFPAVYMPTDPDAVLHVRLMLNLASPLFSALIMFSYFGTVLKVNWWRTPIYWLSAIYTILIAGSLVLALIPGTQLQGKVYVLYFAVSGCFGLLCFVCFLLAVRMIVRAIRRFSTENYSNPDDFPRRFAKGILWLPVFEILVSWIISLDGRLVVLSIGMLILSAMSVGFLIGILSPHRAMDVSQLESGEGPDVPVMAPPKVQADEPEKDDILSARQKEDILQAIRHYVEGEQAFLDSHLTLTSLSRMCGVNRAYVSRVMNERLGGIFVYVNRCRLAYSEELKAKHPDMSLEELAIAAGFGSRQTFYNVRKTLGK